MHRDGERKKGLLMSSIGRRLVDENPYILCSMHPFWSGFLLDCCIADTPWFTLTVWRTASSLYTNNLGVLSSCLDHNLTRVSRTDLQWKSWRSLKYHCILHLLEQLSSQSTDPCPGIEAAEGPNLEELILELLISPSNQHTKSAASQHQRTMNG